MAFNSTQEIIDDIRAGEIVIIMDDEDRENEGDLMIAAEHVTPESINFMVTHGRGLICLTMTKERCEQLQLSLMVKDNGTQFFTNFTVSIEAAEGVTTGISVADRACTVKAAIKANAGPSDVVQPGHIFPLKAQPGGVLIRAGHTEAGCDFARLAGLEPSSVIVEILNEDGTMARRPDLEQFAAKHNLKIGTIADLIEYRNRNESTIERIAESKLSTQYGDFDFITYKDTIDDKLHYALTKGEIKADQPTLVRVHLQNTIGDLLQSNRFTPGRWNLNSAMKRINDEGGALAIISHQESTDELKSILQSFQAEDLGTAKKTTRPQVTTRTIGLGSQILADLGIKNIRLMSAPKKYHSLSGFGLQISEYVAPEEELAFS